MFEEKNHKIATPELVSVRYEIVGLGSRFVGIAIDTVIIELAAAVVYIPLIAVISTLYGKEGGFNITEAVKNSFIMGVAAFMIIFYFTLVWGYHIFYETCRDGRTPGKKLAGIQVIRADGGPITFRDSLLRNLLRIADSMPLFYIVGSLTILFSKNGQRLGDITAGTVVIRNSGASYLDSKRKHIPAHQATPEISQAPLQSAADQNGLPPQIGNELKPAGQTLLATQEYEIVMNFISRRDTLPADTRESIAFELAWRLCNKYSIHFADDVHPEFILESLIAKKD